MTCSSAAGRSSATARSSAAAASASARSAARSSADPRASRAGPAHARPMQFLPLGAHPTRAMHFSRISGGRAEAGALPAIGWRTGVIGGRRWRPARRLAIGAAGVGDRCSRRRRSAQPRCDRRSRRRLRRGRSASDRVRDQPTRCRRRGDRRGSGPALHRDAGRSGSFEVDAVHRLDEAGEPREADPGQPTVLETRDGGLMHTARPLEISLRPAELLAAPLDHRADDQPAAMDLGLPSFAILGPPAHVPSLSALAYRPLARRSPATAFARARRDRPGRPRSVPACLMRLRCIAGDSSAPATIFVHQPPVRQGSNLRKPRFVLDCGDVRDPRSHPRDRPPGRPGPPVALRLGQQPDRCRRTRRGVGRRRGVTGTGGVPSRSIGRGRAPDDGVPAALRTLRPGAPADRPSSTGGRRGRSRCRSPREITNWRRRCSPRPSNDPPTTSHRNPCGRPPTLPVARSARPPERRPGRGRAGDSAARPSSTCFGPAATSRGRSGRDPARELPVRRARQRTPAAGLRHEPGAGRRGARRSRRREPPRGARIAAGPLLRRLQGRRPCHSLRREGPRPTPR